MVEFIGVRQAIEVPGLDKRVAVEEGDAERYVEVCSAEAVFVGAEVNVKGMAVIEFCDGELQDLCLCEQVCHELSGLESKHNDLCLKVFDVRYEFFLNAERKFLEGCEFLRAVIRTTDEEG